MSLYNDLVRNPRIGMGYDMEDDRFILAFGIDKMSLKREEWMLLARELEDLAESLRNYASEF